MKKAVMTLLCAAALFAGGLMATSEPAEAYQNNYDPCYENPITPGYSTYTYNQFYFGSYPRTVTVGNGNVLYLQSVRQLTPYYFYCVYVGYSYQNNMCQ